jgi:steroid 5-alpha reductase family enzyme
MWLPDPSSAWHAPIAGLWLIVLLALCTWVASVWRHDVSLVDRMWPVFIAGAATVYFLLQSDVTLRGACMGALVLAWGTRLCVYITRRNWGHGEDRRYQAIRARNQPGFAFKSLYLVFALQAGLAWTVSTPFMPGMSSSAPFNVLDVLGAALAAFGIVFEAVGDAQMARFKADPANRGQVMDRGLWRYTRHPNYFGEACAWWGFGLMALATGLDAAWTLVSPVLMTVLLLKVSGVSLLEQDMGERRPAYRDYIARTPAFIPGRPKQVAS